MRKLAILLIAVVISISASAQDSLNVSIVGSLYDDHTIYDVALVDHYAYLADGELGLRVVDVSDPSEPVEVLAYETQGDLRNIKILDGYAYAAISNYGMIILDVSSPINPVVVGFYPFPFVVNDIAVSDGYVFIDRGSRVIIVDVTDLSNPVAVAIFDPGDTYAYVAGIDVADNYLYVTGGGNEWPHAYYYLWILDVSDPSSPDEVASYQTQHGMGPLRVVDDFVYATYEWEDQIIGGIYIFNVSNPNEPSIIGSFEVPFRPYNIEVEGDYVYLVRYSGELNIYHVLFLSAITEVGYYDTAGRAYSVAVNGNYAYVADYYHFSIFDCSDATGGGINPQYINISLSTPNPLIVPRGGSFQYEIMVTSNLPSPRRVDFWTYVTLPNDWTYGPLQRINNVPMTPTTVIGPVNLGLDIPQNAFLGEYTFHLQAGAFPNVVAGEDEFPFEVVAATGTNGSPSTDWSAWGLDQLQSQSIAQNSYVEAWPNTFSLSESYPNPFNAATTLTVNLPETSELSVTVYNISGQQVAELANSSYTAGTHRFTFDASGLASGLYLVRATVPGELNAVQKLVLTK